ncbi:MAG: hypothetical protein V8R92_11620 [Eubacterium sp.]|uniref:hypothetical protein n=1 Tax=Eubacterium sp. TaxID=142586 RepID=UPI00300F68E2
MNVISKKKQGIIAIICAIAMVVTSLTIYNPREVKADSEYKDLSYTQIGEKDYWVAAGNDGFPFQTVEDQGDKFLIIPQVAQGTKPIWPNFTDVTLNGEKFDQAAGAGIYIKYADLKENYYNIYEGTSAVDNHRFQIIIKAGNPSSGGEEVIEKPAAPTNFNITFNEEDKTFTVSFDEVEGITTYNFYVGGRKIGVVPENKTFNISDLNVEEGKEYTFGVTSVNTENIESIKVTTKYTVPVLSAPAAPTGLVAHINDEKTNYTVSFANVPTATSYEFYLDGEYKKDITNGGIVTIKELNLEVGKTYKFGVKAVNKVGKSDISEIDVTVHSNETEPTEPFDPTTNKDWTEVKGSNNTILYYIANKASDKVSVKPEMHGDNLYAAFTLAAKFKSVELNGETIKPREGADIEIPKTSFSKEYNKLVVTNYYGKESVTIYFKVVSATEKTKYKVTVDGTPTEVEEGSTYTFGDNAQGYYDTTNSVAYASGEKITVNSDITVTSIKLNVAMQKGASVRLATPTGLRFQTVITSGNDIAASDILNKDFVTTGTLITTFDLFSANGNVLNKDSKYTNLDIANSGWYNDEVGKFCGSIIKIKTDNYEKKFVGVGYATITYHNGDKYSIYADVNETDNARSIYYVANAVKEAGYKNCDAAQKAIIDKYLAKEAF